MKISVITVSKNSAETIKDTLESVASQEYEDIEHILIDGKSTDSTLVLAAKFGSHLAKIISEPDGGIYDAMNKGLRCANGEVVGFLNSDDVFASKKTLSQIADVLKDTKIDAVFGNLLFKEKNKKKRITRFYSSKNFNIKMFKFGIMPPHPTFYIRRRSISSVGFFDCNFEIAGDFDFVLRALYKEKLKSKHVDEVLVHMGAGGKSNDSFRSRIRLNKEIINSCKSHGIETNLVYLLRKIPIRIGEIVRGFFMNIIK